MGRYFFLCTLSLLLLTVLLTALHLHDLAASNRFTKRVPRFSPAPSLSRAYTSSGKFVTPFEAEPVEPDEDAQELEEEEGDPLPLYEDKGLLESEKDPPPRSEYEDELDSDAHAIPTPKSRRFAGDGCNFELCPSNWEDLTSPAAPWPLQMYAVAGSMTTSLPRLYVVVPFRNRLENLARLVSGINNSTTPQLRACTCIVVADFETRLSAVPDWKNKSCLATWDARGIYMSEPDVSGGAADITLEDIVLSMQARSCPQVMYGSYSSDEYDEADMLSAMRSDSHGRGLAQTVTPGFRLPLHVDVSGLRDPDSLRHVLGLFDGSSAIVDAKAFLGNSANVKFSRAGGITAGIDAVSAWERQRGDSRDPLVLVLDVDMLIRPGFWEQVYELPIPGSTVFYPICWHVCFGMSLGSLPLSPLTRASSAGNGGYGMVSAYLSDLQSVKGMSEMAMKASWGKEDELLYKKFVKRQYRIARSNADGLVHLYHSRFKDWSKTADGMFGQGNLGPLVRHVCNAMGHCNCPKGTTPKEVAKRIADETKIRLNPRSVG